MNYKNTIRALLSGTLLLGVLGCSALAPRRTMGPPISFSFDIEECMLREDGYMRKPRHLSFSGRSSNYGSFSLCTIQIAKQAFESKFYTCALSGYSMEAGAMPAGTPPEEFTKIYSQPRSCGFRHLDTSGRYVFEGFGPGRCSFVCLPRAN